MVPARFALCALLCLGGGLGRATAQPSDSSDLPGMTTDRPEYCWHLAGEFAAEQQFRPPPPPDARMLAQEGRDMCTRGHFRGGIERLRRALVMLRTGG